jgi:DNA-binding NtrC family response regulator
VESTAVYERQAGLARSDGEITILVIEDEPFVCAVTCEILEQSGYRVLRAESAAAARKLFLDHAKQIDLLLCDTILPDENGASLSQSLLHQSPGLKIILVSGYPAWVLAKQFPQPTNARFLTKPYSAIALISKVRQALQQDSVLRSEPLMREAGNGQPEGSASARQKVVQPAARSRVQRSSAASHRLHN